MWYVVLDCYPAEDSDNFASNSLAITGCWIKESLANDEESAIRIARQEMEAVRWRVTDVISIDSVGAEDYSDDDEHRQYFEQALIDEFVCQVHQVVRKHVSDRELPLPFLKSMFDNAVDMISRDGAFTLRGSEGEQAIGEFEEELFFPLWITREDATHNSDEWPNCSLRALSAGELKHEYLAQMHSEELLLALGLDQDTMVLFHPLALRDALVRRGSEATC